MDNINRPQYKAQHENDIQNIEYTVFNKWKIVQTKIPVGSSLITIAKKEIDRQLAPNLTFYVKGEGIVVNSNGVVIPNRVAGVYSGNRPNHPMGVTKLTAINDIELWCCNRTHNRGNLPTLTPIIININETLYQPINSKLLICYGTLNNKSAPFEVIYAGEEFIATTTTYILKFEE